MSDDSLTSLIRISPTNPLEDESRWTIGGSRTETPPFLKQMLDEMFEEWIELLSVDDPVRLLYYALPQSPLGWED